MVGVQLLLAGEAGDGHGRAGLDFRALLPALDHIGRLGDQGRPLFLLGAQIGVAGGDMGDFMGHDRGDFRRVIGEGEQPARHEQVARRQGEGVDHG